MEETNFQIDLVMENGSNKYEKLNGNNNSSRTRLALLGSGNYGRALSGRFYQTGVESCVVGSRYPMNKTIEELNVVTYDEAIQCSDIIFLCIPDAN